MSDTTPFNPAADPGPNAEPESLVILTGAGISAASGVPTFRSNGGLWKNRRFEELATPEAFVAEPNLVWDFYRWRQDGVRKAQPNAGHRALARLETILGDQLVLVTQNVDDLHERGGSTAPIHMHGEIMKGRCTACAAVLPELDFHKATETPCPDCGRLGSLRPHIVWFGEMPFHMDRITQAVQRATLFLAIGTSGHVYPAAQYVTIARQCGALTGLINLDPAENSGTFHRFLQGSASEMLEGLLEGCEDAGGFFRGLRAQLG
ncbi:MAG: NAD-dependent deacylase [Magnetococcales bacterium]|nr:NAD-dependent deacylase [Magnetococcales bacterium]